MSSDAVYRKLAERTYWSYDRRKMKQCKFSLDVQVWAIETMGKLNPKSLSASELKGLIERMDTIPKTNPDIACRKAAELAHAKLAATGLLKKP